MHLLVLTLWLLMLMLAPCLQTAAMSPPQARVLVFSKTTGWRHDSIPAAVAALQRLGAHEGIQVDHTEDASRFRPDRLARYQAVVFANTTLDVLDDKQQAAMQDFVRAGGGFMGIHSAADTEYDWAWYGQLVGARFLSHPAGLQTARVQVESDGAKAERNWLISDEIYNFRSNPRERVRVLATVDEIDYTGGSMGEDHPIAWCRAFDGGRSWYTGLGHSIAMYDDAVFQQQLTRGLRYVSGMSDEC
ncbi:MAG: ThuA domain-containing protein [Pseudoxanthomonas sp.]